MKEQHLKRILSILFVVLLPFALMIWYRNHQTTGFAARELIWYPLLFGGTGIGIIYVVKTLFLKEDLNDFNYRVGSWTKDLLWSIVLLGIYFLIFFLGRITLSDVLEFRPNLEMLDLILEMRKHPWMIILFFGPVLWLGVALFEELLRVFLLSSLWKFNQSKIWILTTILLAGILFGLVHWSQGPYGIVTISIKSLVSGFFYYKIRRFWPLVIAHAFYDGIQVAVLLVTYPG